MAGHAVLQQPRAVRSAEAHAQLDTIVGELAERWAWQENYRKLVFFLRRDVRWHDGKPFSSKDVKYTFDLLRETPDAPAKLRLNARREWYANVDAVDAVDPQTVVFRLTFPGETAEAIADHSRGPAARGHQVNAGVLDTHHHSRKPPFDNVTVRQA